MSVQWPVGPPVLTGMHTEASMCLNGQYAVHLCCRCRYLRSRHIIRDVG